MKRIDVAVACWQGERFLPEQLASLRRQDDPAFDVLLGDDGSTDETPALLSAVCREDARFHPAPSLPGKRGAIGHFWRLLSLCEGDYTALCDQDDVWETDHLSRLRLAMTEAEARYGADTPLLVHGDCRVTDEDGHVLHESFFAHQGWDKQAVTLPQLLVQNNVTGCTCLMNAPLRRLALHHGNPEKMIMHDWFLALTAAAFGHVVFVDAPLVRYRQHRANVQGASAQGLVARGLRALKFRQRGRDRIALTYRHARDFLAAYDTVLPEDARRIVTDYLAIENMPKLRRLTALRKGNYLMQSTVTRMGQMVFG